MIRGVIGILIATVTTSVVNGQDTIHVKAGAPAWGNNVGISELYTLGSAPDYRIRVFYGMAVDRFNQVYIHDLNAYENNPRIDAYDANGNFLRTLGRKGSGPGEYRTVFGMTIVEDSILAAIDFSTSRITLFEPDGRLVRTIPLTHSYTGTSWFALKSDTSNLMYLRTRTWVYGPDGKLSPIQPPEGRPTFVRMKPDGTIVDSLLAPLLPELPTPRFNLSFVDDYTTSFVPEVVVTPTAIGGLVFGRGDVHRFTIQPVYGLARVVERDWKPIELTSEERSEWIAVADARRQKDGTLGGFPIAKTKPAYRDLFVDRDGRTWVSLYAAATKRELPPRKPGATGPQIFWRQQPVFDVFDPAGRYLGNVALPYGSTIVAAHDDRVWVKHTGSDDEHLVTAYKLTGIRGH